MTLEKIIARGDYSMTYSNRGRLLTGYKSSENSTFCMDCNFDAVTDDRNLVSNRTPQIRNARLV